MKQHYESELESAKIWLVSGLLNDEGIEVMKAKKVFFEEQLKQICYKTNEPCNYNCNGLCKESC